jgi:hypothetical protein
MTTSPRPAFLMPLRLEIWHDDNSAKIRWYPDDCHIIPDRRTQQEGGKGFDNSLEGFLGKGYELKTFPHKVSLYTFTGGKVAPLVDGKNINDDEAFNDLKEIAKEYSQNIQIEIKDFVLNLSCEKVYSETRDEILSKAKSSQKIYQELFEKYEEEVTNHVHINLPDKRFYKELKRYAKRYNIGWLKFNDGTFTVQLLRLVSKIEINILQRYLPQNWLASFRIKYESIGYSKTVYGVLHPRIGDPALPANKWMTDFCIAEASGMAVTLDGKRYQRLRDAEWLIATGVRDEEDNLLEDIFQSHIEAGNLKILKQGEPTNNTRQEKVAPIKIQKPKEGEKPLPAANSNRLSLYLGVKPETFAEVDDSSSRDEKIVEVINHLFWPVCSVNYFNQIYQTGDGKMKAESQKLFNETQERFIKHVNAKGHLPAIRIGENPYGFVLTAPRRDCEESPFFKTFGMDLHTLRQKFLDIANSHGRFMNTEGVSLEEVYDEHGSSNTKNKKNFHNYVLSKHKPVYSRTESDFERLENILRQNAVSNRLDLENDTVSVSLEGLPGVKILEHLRSSDALLLKSSETKEVVIKFLRTLKEQLKANAFVLELLLVSKEDFEALIRYFKEATNSINRFDLDGNICMQYLGQEWNNHKTTLDEIKKLILKMKNLHIPRDLQLVIELVTKIQSALRTLPKIDKLSDQEVEMQNVLILLTEICLNLEGTGTSITTEMGKIREIREKNHRAAISFIMRNPSENNRLDSTCTLFVRNEFTKLDKKLGNIENPFSEAKEATNKIKSNLAKVKNGLMASAILSIVSPVFSEVQSIQKYLKGGVVQSKIINAKISSLDTSGFSLAEEKLTNLVDIKNEISASWSRLIQIRRHLADQVISDNISEWVTNYLKSLEKVKNVLELSLAWKESMPILRRMLVLSIIYACRGGYIDKDYSRVMINNLDRIIKWLESGQLTIQELETIIMQVLDCFSSRMDAWITAEVEVLNQPENKRGRTLGVYGFLENPISEGNPNPPEFFQAPSLDQAKTTAILRAGSLTDKNAFQINLTGERINQAVWFVQGLQKGYSPAELLGRYAERLIHGESIDDSIDVVLLPLRKKFPLYVREDDSSPGFMNIIDGQKFEACQDQDIEEALKNIQGVDSDVIQKTKAVKQQTKSLRDAMADLSIAETVYQQVTGNTAGVQAWLEASEGKVIPPFPQVVRTPRTGYSKVQRILFPIKAIETLDKTEGRTPREISEPSFAEYLESALRGYRNLKINITVTETSNPETVLDTAEISCSDLGISAFDLVVGGKSLLINCARIKYWLNLLETNPKNFTDIIHKEPEEFFNSYEVLFIPDKEIIDSAAQVQGLLRAVSPIEISDLDIVPKDDELEPLDKQRQEVIDRKDILEKKISMWQCLNSRNAQLCMRIQNLLESPIETDIEVQKFLLQAILWSIKNTEYPITVTGERKEEGGKVLKGIKSELQKIKDKLGSLGKDGKEQEDKINSDIAKIKEYLNLGVQLDWETIYTQLDEGLKRIDHHIANLSSKLKAYGGGEGMIILPPIQAPYKLDVNNIKDAEGDLRELKFVRKNMKLFFQYLDKINNVDMPKYQTYKYPFKSWEDVVNQALLTLNPNQSKDLSNIEIKPSKESWKTSSADLHFFSCSENALEPVTNGTLFTGLKIDEWTDFIPKNQETTGITFNCDVPQSEAPNCFLLCAPSKTSEPTPGSLNWKLDDLADAIANVIDLMRMRTLTTDDILADPALQKYLPTLRYSREFASDFPLELMTFISTSEFLHEDIPSVSAYYEQLT